MNCNLFHMIAKITIKVIPRPMKTGADKQTITIMYLLSGITGGYVPLNFKHFIIILVGWSYSYYVIASNACTISFFANHVHVYNQQLKKNKVLTHIGDDVDQAS